MLLLILLPIKVDAVAQEENCKKNTVRTLGSNGGKVIFTLLTKVIIIYVRFTTINVR